MIPQGPAFMASIKKGIPPAWKTDHPAMLEFIQSLSGDICMAWTQWSLGLSVSTFTVSGLGIGAWAGSGSGAKLVQGPPFNVVITWKYKDFEHFKKFGDAITKEYKAAFAKYCDTFKFSTAAFTGTCGSSGPLPPPAPPVPGPVSALTPPSPLAVVKSDAKLPDALKSKIIADLPSAWDNNSSFIKIIVGALQDATTEHFKLWETSSMFTGDTFTFPLADPITGAAAGPSLGIGKIV